MYSTVKMLRTAAAPSFNLGDADEPPTPKTNSAADLSNEQLEDAIAEADSMIDGAIRSRYATPVAAVDGIIPSPISFWSRNLALYLATCTFRRSQDFTDTDPVYRRFLVTQKYLDAVAKGQYTLPLPGVDTSTGGQGNPGASAPINPNGGTLFDGSDLDLYGPSWPGVEYGQLTPFMHPLVNPVELPYEFFERLQMAYTPQTNDVTKISGSIIDIASSATPVALTLGRQHRVTGAAAQTLTIPTPTVNGTIVSVKVDDAYTGPGVTMPSGMQQAGVLSAGQDFDWFWNGSVWSIE